MSAQITREGKAVRPSFNFRGPNSHGEYDTDAIAIQLIESVRNVLEDVAGSHTLQCDVAHAIKDMAKTLRRIDRRLAKLEGTRLK